MIISINSSDVAFMESIKLLNIPVMPELNLNFLRASFKVTKVNNLSGPRYSQLGLVVPNDFISSRFVETKVSITNTLQNILPFLLEKM